MSKVNASTNLLNNDVLLLYKHLLEKLPDLIFQLNISQENDFSFPFLNRNILSFFNISKFELKSNAVFVISNKIHKEDKDDFFNSLFEAKKNLNTWSHEFRLNFEDKNNYWFKVDATVEKGSNNSINFIGKLTDINALKEKELELEFSKARHEFALEASNNGIWDYEIKTDKVYFSKQSLKIIGATEADNIDTNEKWDNRIHKEDFEDYKTNIIKHFNFETPFFESVKRILTNEGTYRWVLSKGKVIERDKAGNPLRVVGTHTDVTNEILREKELITNFELINKQNNKLLNFAYIVSHNLRSHTCNLQMLIQILEQENEFLHDVEGFIYLKETAQTLTNTIEHLKELVDININLDQKIEELDLFEYINEIIKLLQQEINEKEIMIINNVKPNSFVNFNSAYLQSVLLNLTTNAIKYSSNERNPKIEFNYQIDDNKSTLFINDNGLGIDLKKHGDKIFGMYKTFHNNKASNGLGLFLVKNQIEAIGGEITVTSEENIGTSFMIKFNNDI